MTSYETLPKAVSETQILRPDFISSMPSGVTISSAAASQAVYSGTPSTLTLGAASISGSRVSVPVAGGTAGTIYQVTVAATLSDGQILRMRTLLAVTPNTL